MAESRLIPTITVVEYRPPIVDIITYYELLLGLPNVFQAFIAAEGEIEVNLVDFKYGDGGFVIKNWPDQTEVSVDHGELTVIADDEINDAQYYFIDSDGYMRYFFKDIPFVVSNVAGFLWGLDFTNPANMTLGGGNEITNISQYSRTWSSTGSARPIYVAGEGAVFDGIDDFLKANFTQDAGEGRELFIVAKALQPTTYMICQGKSAIPDGKMLAFGTHNNRVSFYQAITGESNSDGSWPVDSEFHLFYWKKASKHRLDGFQDNNPDIGKWNGDNAPSDELVLGRTVRSTSQLYSLVSIKEVLFFDNLAAEDRKDVETYLKFKHDLPVYVNSH